MPIIKKNETLLDFIAINTGSIEALMQVANLNGIGITDDVAAGSDLKIGSIPAFTIAKYKIITPELVFTVIKKNQTVLDFSTQFFGTAEALFLMANLNGIGITDDVAPGVELVTEVVNKNVVNAFKLRGLDITTSIVYDPAIINGGIGLMQIQNDFKVS